MALPIPAVSTFRSAWIITILAAGEVMKRKMGCDLKPFEAIQRVRPPPGKGAARQPEASLAWETVTSLVKRRQRMLKPCVSLEIMCPLRPSVWVARGQHRQDRQGEILSARPGSWSRAKAWNGSPGNLRDPACVHVCSTPVRGAR